MKIKDIDKDAFLGALRVFFENSSLPDKAHLYPFVEITNPRKFVDSHLETVYHYWGNNVARPYLRRLLQFQEQIEQRNGNPRV